MHGTLLTTLLSDRPTRLRYLFADRSPRTYRSVPASNVVPFKSDSPKITPLLRLPLMYSLAGATVVEDCSSYACQPEGVKNENFLEVWFGPAGTTFESGSRFVRG